MVNPKITKSSKEKSTFYEGCLSFPEIRAQIKRPKEVEVEYLDYNGQKQTLKANELLSTCVQHEIDHLNGITFVDYLSKTKREMLLRKMNKLLKSRL
jgi:peptide deformylase